MKKGEKSGRNALVKYSREASNAVEVEASSSPPWVSPCAHLKG